MMYRKSQTYNVFVIFSSFSDMPTAPTAFFLPVKVVNGYSGAIRLKTSLPSPNNYFKVLPGIPLTKVIELREDIIVAFTAFSVMTNKKLHINGEYVFVATPKQSTEQYEQLYVTDMDAGL